MMETENFIWQGRFDGSAPAHRRFYQAVSRQERADFTLFGFACDEGVRRNGGRTGAADAPDAIRRQLANFALHQDWRISDWGNVGCTDGDLAAAQQQLAVQIGTALARKSVPVIFGGGHEVAYAGFHALFAHVQNEPAPGRIGIINIDAHFDLRRTDIPSSGTPFFQAARTLHRAGREFHYLCLGIARHSNTAALFETADELGCRYFFDTDIHRAAAARLSAEIERFAASVEHLYLSIDLDAFPAALAPGVSAPAARGIDLATTEILLEQICRSGKVRLFDIAECNPHFDTDNRTARLAAYLTYQLIGHIHQTKEPS
ncbi:formimidoylglutamase [Neisseria leonii]|uniref:Formimidoylglutamase n=1 Tax=Neisseria leonii TaxID=2995413 RepID=A0A9X4E4V3_9NEIS|nr:formimidoylglutamase [Neisseria sp. 51.81]